MKNLTYDELLKAPAKVKFLYSMAMMNEPVGSQIKKDAIKENPEYFPDEIALENKWDLIPQTVQDEYWVEREKIRKDIYKDMPPSKGIIGWSMDGDKNGYYKWQNEWDKCYKAEMILAKEIHQKYYGKYNIEFIC